MGYGRATATFVSSTAPSSSAARDDFLSRLASAESRDGGTPTGGAEEQMLGTHAGEDPRYVKAHRTRSQQMSTVQAKQQQQHWSCSPQAFEQKILPSKAYNHHGAYRQQPNPPEAAIAAAAIAQHYAPSGAGRDLVSRQLRRHFQPIHSQVDLCQSEADPDEMRHRVSFPVRLPPNEDRRQGKGSMPADQPAGGRANLAGKSDKHGTGHYHHHHYA